MNNLFPTGTRIWSRDGKKAGVSSGNQRCHSLAERPAYFSL